ncbi:hypothetical protein [Sphingomonas sp.]|uniref:hypothetical protein n=1 Tax=Sphingomonas sp. TaxID=28214 RepID=UPI0025D89E51|nr:hypothetical protein [Sphingomonas sp.]
MERRAARLDLVDSKLDYLRYARQCRATHKTAEEIAKFGSGSLFGATALLLLTTSAAPLVAGTAGLTLLLFLGGTTIASMFDRKSAQWEHKAARIDAVLAEADR